MPMPVCSLSRSFGYSDSVCGNLFGRLDQNMAVNELVAADLLELKNIII
jgi:hypothetical protein